MTLTEIRGFLSQTLVKFVYLFVVAYFMFATMSTAAIKVSDETKQKQPAHSVSIEI